MAAFQSIQKHPALLLGVLGGGLILMIIMFGFDDYNGFFQGDRDVVMSVNDHKIKFNEYDTERQHQADFIQTVYGQDVNKAEVSHQINNQIYSQFVQQTLLGSEFEELGINVSDAEMNELVQGSHISPVLTQIFGQYASAYGQYFAQLAQNDGFDEASQQSPILTANNWSVLEEQIKNTRLTQKYNALLATAVKPNKLEAEDVFNGENTDVAFSYVSKRSYEISDSVINVSNSDIKAYYENHKESFKQNQKTREISYIAVPVRPSNDDRSVILTSLQKATPEFTEGDVKEVVSANSVIGYIDAYLNVNTFHGELKEFVDNNEAGAVSEPAIYNGDILSMIGEHSENDESLSEYYWMARIEGKQSAPDSIKLVVATATAENQDSLYNEVKKGSQDSIAQWATNLSTMNFEQGLRDKLAATKAGETFKYDFNNGQQQMYLVCKITEKTAPVDQAKVAIYAEEITPSSKTRSLEYRKLKDFMTDYPSIQQMQDSALSNGFRMMDATVSTTSYNINQVRECRQAVRFAFDSKKGDISEIYDESGYLLVVATKGDVQEGYASLDNEQLTSYIRMQLTPEKKIDYIIKNELANVADKSIEGYAAAMGVSVQEASRVNFNMSNISGLGVEPKVIAEALKNAEGTVVGPIAGNSNVVVIKVGAKTDKGLTFNEDEYKNKVNNNVYRNPANAALQVLNNNAEIEDNRIRFY